MMRRNVRLFLLTLAAAGGSSCRDIADPGAGAGDAMLTVRADVANLTIATMSVTVTASDITTPLIFNLQIADGIAQGTMTVRTGSARHFAARAFDEAGVETHFGESTLDVRPAGNPMVRMVLVPRAGGVPIEIVLGGILVTVTSPSATLDLDQTAQLTAAVTNGDGGAIDLPVQWASSNPARATVDANGLVRGIRAGEVQIVATAGGEAGAAALIVAPSQWVFLVAGSNHTCGLANGRAYCWGLNSSGQLGDGSRENHSRPVAVAGEHQFSWLVAGRQHTCGAADNPSRILCWGSNQFGQIGDGTTQSRLVPTQVAGNPYGPLATRLDHTCVLAGSVEVYCWGSNADGQIGNHLGTVVNKPSRVVPELTFISTSSAIATGDAHTCALAQQGTFCWGANSLGQLGNGDAQPFTELRSVGGVPTSSVTVLEAGADHTCALSGAAFCWGSNSSNQIDDGAQTNRPTVVVLGDPTVQLKDIALGKAHTCTLTVAGMAVCWGRNSFGQLGTTPVAFSALGIIVPGVFESITAGAEHTCAITSSKQAYCWGQNQDGRLGNATTGDRHSPTRVREP